MHLYQLTSQYREALAVLNDCDLSDLTPDEQQDLLETTLEPFEFEINNKILSVGKFIANLELEAEALKTMEQRIQVRRKSNERKAEWLTNYAHVSMETMKLTEVKDNQIKLNIRKNPPKVVITNESLLPSEFTELQTTTLIRKNLISESLKLGNFVPGAHLQNSTRLQIK